MVRHQKEAEMNRFSYNDGDIREFFRNTKNPLEQVFICADLCTTTPLKMFKKLCELRLTNAALLPAVMEEIRRRKSGKTGQ